MLSDVDEFMKENSAAFIYFISVAGWTAALRD